MISTQQLGTDSIPGQPALYNPRPAACYSSAHEAKGFPLIRASQAGPQVPLPTQHTPRGSSSAASERDEHCTRAGSSCLRPGHPSKIPAVGTCDPWSLPARHPTPTIRDRSTYTASSTALSRTSAGRPEPGSPSRIACHAQRPAAAALAPCQAAPPGPARRRRSLCGPYPLWSHHFHLP